ncbi:MULTISPECIES: helix-hairpin-helix domain-containing protein [unclassified Ekhidna]|jgi:competence protein ComEA|uniref:ComEA family DNA-binding protein n=1 Tax=unclassified Ekhidna TaxID=2632188 RepID=UPI0032DF3192
MLKYLTDTISRAIGFTKTESRGALVLIFIIIVGLFLTNWGIRSIKKGAPIVADSTALKWMEEVQASIEVKKESKSTFDKSVYLPTKKPYKKRTKTNVSSSPKKEAVRIEIKDLNKATAEELQIVKGIGPAYSERIVKYRKLLGGFADTTQLNEVYGLQSETIKELVKHFQIMSDVNPIEINTDSLKVLSKHPYINYDLARIILNYRRQHGDITSPEDLLKIKAIDERTFLRLKPYLD